MTKELSFRETRRIRKECPVCEAEKELAYGEINEILNVRKVPIEVTSRINHCIDGDHYFYDIEDEEEKFQFAYREYKKLKGFLQPEEIKAIRQQYGLSQKNFARLLNWGDITIQRYESGGIQDDPHNDILMMLRDFNDFKRYFETKRHMLDPKLVNIIQEKINTIEKEKTTRTMDLIIKLFSKPTVGSERSFSVVAEPDYITQLPNGQYCSNEELALAA